MLKKPIIILSEVSHFLNKANQAGFAGEKFNAGFALFIANPTLIGFPIFVTSIKIGKLQLFISSMFAIDPDISLHQV